VFKNRQRFALETDLCNGVHPNCPNCGPSLGIPNLNQAVRYEGRLILVDTDTFLPHPNQSTPCCTGHSPIGVAESNPPTGTFPDDSLIRVNGRIPLHIGDFTECLSTIIPGSL
jgi:hypothetical protein